MAKFMALSRGTRIVLVAGPLLFFSLFLTWQNVEVDYGRAGVAPLALDGWDVWGLLLALLDILIVTVVVIGLTEEEPSGDTSRSTLTFALGVAVLAVAVVKNLTDAGSSWTSYGFVALAAAVAIGTYLDWAAGRKDRKPILAQKRRGIRSAA